jgi:hypothetical protein
MAKSKIRAAVIVVVGLLPAAAAFAADWRYVGTPPTGITLAQVGPDKSPNSPTVRHCPAGSTATIDGSRLLCRVLGPDLVDFTSWDDQIKEYAPMSCNFQHSFPEVSWSFKKSFTYQACVNGACSPSVQTPDLTFGFKVGGVHRQHGQRDRRQQVSVLSAGYELGRRQEELQDELTRGTQRRRIRRRLLGTSVDCARNLSPAGPVGIEFIRTPCRLRAQYLDVEQQGHVPSHVPGVS